MDQLDRASQSEQALLLTSEQAPGIEAQGGPQPFSPRKYRVPHRLMNAGGKFLGSGEKAIESRINAGTSLLKMQSNCFGRKQVPGHGGSAGGQATHLLGLPLRSGVVQDAEEGSYPGCRK